MLTSRKSRFFNWFKIRSKHDSHTSKTSSEEFHSLPSTPTSPTHPSNLSHPINPISPSDVEPEDQCDGFYQYGNSFKEDPLSLLLSPYQVPKDNDHDERGPAYFSMTPPNRLSRPYTVSSEEWVVLTSSPSSSGSPPALTFPNDDLTDEQRVAHFGAVLKIFTKLYTMAKILNVAFLAYGVHLDHSQTGLMYWIKRAEAEIRTNSLATLIEIVENLYYVLYSRLVLEMANAELCYLHKTVTRPLSTYRQFVLPVPDHLYEIFLVFKEVLDAPSMCEEVQTDLVTYYQQSYLDRIIRNSAVKDFASDDILKLRRRMARVASDKTSEYYTKWDKLIPLFHSIPPNILATLAEKYLTVFPIFVLDDDIPLSQLPFRDVQTVDPEERRNEIILDNRVATLAMLQGTCVGDERRNYGQLCPFPLAKQKRCICKSICSCASGCTHDVKRPCPCAEQQLRILLARRRQNTGTTDFMTRANTLGRAYFQKLSFLKPDVAISDIAAQTQIAFDDFKMEIEKERANVQALVWIK